jgi:hypothetical protein
VEEEKGTAVFWNYETSTKLEDLRKFVDHYGDSKGV